MLHSKSEAPSEIGIYKIQEKLGTGHNSIVYKAINTKDNSIVAIKQVPLGHLYQNTIKNMQMNLKLLRNLEHQNLMKYIDNTQTESHLYMMQEYVPSIINKETICNEEITALFTKQILKALEYLHSRNILHRDIQRANILSSDGRHVKLLNYGRPSRLGVNENGDFPDSSLHWTAPEVLKGEAVSSGSDIWSLGCTVIELLTGFPPYYGLKPMEFAMKMVGDEEVPLPKEISKDCEDFLRKCLNKNVKQRANVKELLEHQWVCNCDMEKFGNSQENEKED